MHQETSNVLHINVPSKKGTYSYVKSAFSVTETVTEMSKLDNFETN